MTTPTEAGAGVALPMALPRCDQHGEMVLSKPGTREQEWCGTWYRCTRCTSSVLLSSRELTTSLDRPGAQP